MEHTAIFSSYDLHHITRIEGLYRRMHQPQSRQYLRGENPWESVQAGIYRSSWYIRYPPLSPYQWEAST